MKIAFYTSAHGYGHASRSFEIARALAANDPETEIFFMSSVPDSFFAADEHERIQRRNCRLDVGMRQIDSLSMDLPGTVADLDALVRQSGQLVAEEADFINRHGINLVLVDLPFLAFEAAQQAKIPAWGISNFTWDWIYGNYLDAYPAFQPHIERIRRACSLAEGIFRLPFHHDMPAFRQIIDIPLVARKSLLGWNEARKRLQIKPAEKVVLFSFGGFGQELNLASESMQALKLITSDPSPWPGAPFIHLSNSELNRQGLRYCDLVAAADVVVTKLGYGIVSECMANQTALVYTPRGQFREYPILAEAVKRRLPAAEILPDTFTTGEWVKICLDVLEREMPPARDADGIDFIVERLTRAV